MGFDAEVTLLVGEWNLLSGAFRRKPQNMLVISPHAVSEPEE